MTSFLCFNGNHRWVLDHQDGCTRYLCTVCKVTIDRVSRPRVDPVVIRKKPSRTKKQTRTLFEDDTHKGDPE